MYHSTEVSTKVYIYIYIRCLNTCTDANNLKREIIIIIYYCCYCAGNYNYNFIKNDFQHQFLYNNNNITTNTSHSPFNALITQQILNITYYMFKYSNVSVNEVYILLLLLKLVLTSSTSWLFQWESWKHFSFSFDKSY